MPNDASATETSGRKASLNTVAEVVKILPEDPMKALIAQVHLLREKKKQEIEKQERKAQFLREEQAKVRGAHQTSRLDDKEWLAQQAEKKRKEEEMKAKLIQPINKDLQKSAVGLVQEAEPTASQVKAAPMKEEDATAQQQRDQSRDKMRNLFMSNYTSENSKKADDSDFVLPDTAAKVSTTAAVSSSSTAAAASAAAPTVSKGAISLTERIGRRVFADEDVEVAKPKVENKELISDEEWNSTDQESRKFYSLPQFELNGNNTIQLTVRVPQKSQAWSLNLSPVDDFYGTDILFHYNPRYAKRHIVLNDRQGTWGDYTLRDLDNRPSRDCVIRIYITHHGFYLYTDSRFEIFFRHRRDIQEYLGTELKLWFSYRDDNGKPHSIIVKKVLWQHNNMDTFLSGRSKNVVSTVNDLLTAPVTESVSNPMKLRTVLMRGLPVLSDLKVLQGIEYAFFDVFKDFEPSSISLVPGTHFAFVRLSKASSVMPAIAEFDNMEIAGPSGEMYTLRLTPVVARDADPVPAATTTTPPIDDVTTEVESRPAKRSRYDVDDEDESSTPAMLPPTASMVHNKIEMDEGHTPDIMPPTTTPPAASTTPDMPASSTAMEVVNAGSTTPQDDEHQVTPEKPIDAAVPEEEEEDDDYDDLY